MHVLTSLGIEDELDLILTREDVENAKPDPEIYLLDARTLGLEPEDCIVLENSLNGLRAGVAAGMNVLAVATPFTMAGLHSSEVLDHPWVVHDPEKLVEAVSARIAEHDRTAHG